VASTNNYNGLTAYFSGPQGGIFKGRLVFRPKTAGGRLYVRIYDGSNTQFILRGMSRTHVQNDDQSYSVTDNQTYQYLTRYGVDDSTSLMFSVVNFTLTKHVRSGQAYAAFFADTNFFYSSTYPMHSTTGFICHHPTQAGYTTYRITFWLADGAYFGTDSTITIWDHCLTGDGT